MNWKVSNTKLTQKKAKKHLLVENEFEKLKTLDSSYFVGKIRFEENAIQNYFVFQSIYRYFERVSWWCNYVYYLLCISKVLSDKSITAHTTIDYKLNPELSYFVTKTRVEFNGSCLKQNKITYDHGKVENIYIVYEIGRNINFSNYPTLENCFFGAVSLTKNADIDH